MAARITMDGTDLKQAWGIDALRGSYNDLVRLPDIKENVKIDRHDENYTEHHLVNRKIASRDIVLTFLMSSGTAPTLMVKRDNFLAALKADGSRLVKVESLMRAFRLIYKSCDGVEFLRLGGSTVRAKLKLKFTIINEYSIADMEEGGSEPDPQG